MVKILLIIFFLLPTTCFAIPSYTIEFGNTQTVYSWTKDQCYSEDFPDFPPRALVDINGNLQLYSGDYLNRKFIGSNLTDIKHDCHITLPSDNNENPAMNNDYEFLTSTYTIDGTTVYGLVHNEYHGSIHNNCNSTNPTDCRWNSINLVTSIDAGYNFTHLDPPNQTIAQTSIPFNPNNKLLHTGFFQPSNIIKKDNYYYAKMTVRLPGYSLNNPGNYGSEGICVMRTQNLSDPNSWKLWDGNGWNVSPKGVPNSGLCAKTFNSDWDWHYSNYFDTYLSVGAFPGNANYQGVIQSSSNLTTIDTPDTSFKTNTNRHSVYYTFLQPGAETRNFEDIGRSPWMYYVTCGDDNSPCVSFTNSNRDLRRVRVRFNKTQDIGKYDVLDLKFNEYKGLNTLDSSFYGNDGTISGDTTFKQEGDIKYISFGGNTGNILINNSPSLQLSGDVTFIAKIRTNQTPASNIYPPIFVKQGSSRNYGLFLAPNGQLHLVIPNGSIQTSSNSKQKINDGLWHDIQINYSDTTDTVTYKIDNKLDSQTNQVGKLSNDESDSNLYIGGNLFTGDIDQLSIYNYLLPVNLFLADTDNNDKVDLLDFAIWKNEYLGATNTKLADFNYDNIVNLLDFAIWKTNYLQN